MGANNGGVKFNFKLEYSARFSEAVNDILSLICEDILESHDTFKE